MYIRRSSNRRYSLGHDSWRRRTVRGSTLASGVRYVHEVDAKTACATDTVLLQFSKDFQGFVDVTSRVSSRDSVLEGC
jgi:hypothetical protein